MKPLRWLLIAGGAALIGLGCLIFNGQQADKLAAEVIRLDAADRPTSAALQKLKSFSASHMNASSQVELVYSYQRAVGRDQSADQSQVNGQVYAQAQAACATAKDSVVQARCVADFVSKHSAPAPEPDGQLPQKDQFRHSYISPAWAPDAAGLFLLLAAASLVMAGLQLLRR